MRASFRQSKSRTNNQSATTDYRGATGSVRTGAIRTDAILAKGKAGSRVKHRAVSTAASAGLNPAGRKISITIRMLGGSVAGMQRLILPTPSVSP